MFVLMLVSTIAVLVSLIAASDSIKLMILLYVFCWDSF